MTDEGPEVADDAALVAVEAWFKKQKNFESEFPRILRKALDEVIDGGRTGRWAVSSLQKTEKTYIGTKVEILLKYEMGMLDGHVLDALIEGHEMDIKCTVGGGFGWMIPDEAIGQLCLLVSVNDETCHFRVGLMRTSRDVLNSGVNKDGKATILAAARARITWLIEAGSLPPNFLSTIPAEIRSQIMSHRSGQRRINELFRLVQRRIISRNALETVARQLDPMKRMRDARLQLAPEGILVLGHQDGDPETAASYGLPIPKKGEAISFSLGSPLTPSG